MALLEKRAARLRGRAPRRADRSGSANSLDEAFAAVDALDHSYLFIQGPPGSGKTYTGSHLIVALLAHRQARRRHLHQPQGDQQPAEGGRGGRAEKGVRFSGVKKSSTTDPESAFNGRLIESIPDRTKAIAARAQLLAGTAWLFADKALEDSLDYLFVDEAGQVSLANLVASGTAAKNIVLLGDQMQLGQPIQGVHPGRSGESALDYLLDGLATIPPDRGIFLPTTYRMHADVCRFISEAVYDCRLHPEPANQRQRLLLDSRAHPALRPTGIAFLPLEHDGNSQRSAEEADAIRALYASLLEQRYRNKQGEEHPMARGQHPRRRALQLAGEPAPVRPSARRPRRHDRQVSGAGGRGGADLDGHFERRLPAAEYRVSIRQESVERGDFASEVFGGGGSESGVDAYQVRDARADGARQHLVLGRAIRRPGCKDGMTAFTGAIVEDAQAAPRLGGCSQFSYTCSSR